MGAPNAPNPANPNAQDQFVDATQGPTNQVQGPAVQDQAQGPAVQIQVQGPVNNNAQVGQNIPVQPPQQPAPAQPIPAGLVVPAPEVVYQNWIGKKPEFSGKLKRMWNHIFSVPEIGWKHTTSQMRSKLHIFV